MKALGFLRAKQEWESGNKGINHLKQSESGLCCCTCRTPPRNKWQAMPLLERARKAWGGMARKCLIEAVQWGKLRLDQVRPGSNLSSTTY